MERTAPGEEREIDKLRKTIEELRTKAERNGTLTSQGTTPSSAAPGPPFTYPEAKGAPGKSPEVTYPASDTSSHWSSSSRNYDPLSPNSNKRISSGSLSSMSSHASHSSVSSSGSGSSADNAQRKEGKKRRWLPLKSAFSRGGKGPQTAGGPEFNDADDSGCPVSPTTSRRILHNPSLGLTPRDGRISYNEILQIVQEKDRRLTDVRLEALTSQHQLHQLKDQIAQMQHEMQLLRMENERLQASAVPTDYVTTPSSTMRRQRSNNSEFTPFREEKFGSSASPSDAVAFNPAQPRLDCCKLHRLVSPGSEEDGAQIRFTVRTPASVRAPAGAADQAKGVLVGSVPVPRKTSWVELDQMTSDIFLEYCRCVDGDGRLGLSTGSLSYYKVGEQTRVPGTSPPELLPCAFLIGDVNTVEISLKDATCGSVDLMAFTTLIPKDTLLRYVNVLMHNKRVLLHGPSGTGKSSLAHSLALHLVTRVRKQADLEKAIYVYDVKQKGEQELHNYLRNISDVCQRNNAASASSIPHVIIVENSHLVTSLNDVFNPLLNLPADVMCPYVIGTILQGKVQAKVSEECKTNFAFISCTNNSSHVKDYLWRFLRRAVIENEITSQQPTCEEEFDNTLRVITWLPLCWHHVNRCLESQCTTDVTIGPRVFASCPPDFYSSCTWFVQVWNHVIAPYVITAVRRVRQSDKLSNPTAWKDPTSWVVESFPWNASDMGCDNTLRLKHVTSDDLSTPPVPPRTDLLSAAGAKDEKAEPLSRRPPPPVPVHKSSSNATTDNNLSLPRKLSTCASVEHQRLSNSDVFSAEDCNVWLRQTSSPVASPAKSVRVGR